jgi:hypothetical protein
MQNLHPEPSENLKILLLVILEEAEAAIPDHGLTRSTNNTTKSHVILEFNATVWSDRG